MSRIQKINTSFFTVPSFKFIDSWGDLSTGLSNGSGLNNNLIIDLSSNVYVGGQFTLAGDLSVNNVAKWDGTTWIQLGSGIFKGVNKSTGNTIVTTMTLDNSGNLYVGGRFDQAGDFLETNNVAKWNGSVWSSLSSGTSGGVITPNVYSLCSDNQNNIYVGGEFTIAGGIPANRIAKWNGSSWSTLGSGIGSGLDTDLVFSTIVDNSNNLLYVGGRFNIAGGISVNNIAVWNLNSSTWSAVPGSNGFINSLALDDNNNLYAGGLFTTMGGITANYVAKWDGSSWSSLSSPFNVNVNSITFKNGKLYVSGAYTQTGAVNVPRLAVWDGSTWTILNTTSNNFITDVAVNNNNKVYITGQFTTPGNRIAQQTQITSTSYIIIPSSSANSKRIRTI